MEGRLHLLYIMPCCSYSSIWLYFLTFSQLLIGNSNSTAYVLWFNMYAIPLNSKGLFALVTCSDKVISAAFQLVPCFSYSSLGSQVSAMVCSSNSSHLTKYILNSVSILAFQDNYFCSGVPQCEKRTCCWLSFGLTRCFLEHFCYAMKKAEVGTGFAFFFFINHKQGKGLHSVSHG